MSSSKIIHKSAWIHLVDGRVLSTRSKGKQTYYFPGGKPEVGETPEEALIREIKEELTADLIPGTISLLGIFEGPAHGHVDTTVCMTCFTAGYHGTLMPAAEIAEVLWLQYADIESTSPVDQIIFRWLHERNMLF